MYKSLVQLAVLISITFSVQQMYANSLGLGIILLDPTGFTGNYKLNRNNSVDAAMSWSLNDDDQNLYLHSTYLWHKRNLIKADKVKLNVHFGGGGRLISWDDPPGKDHDSELRLGLRGVGGVGYTFRKPEIEIFAELSVTMDIIPKTDVDFGLGIGTRFYF